MLADAHLFFVLEAELPMCKKVATCWHFTFVSLQTILEIRRGISAPTKGTGIADLEQLLEEIRRRSKTTEHLIPRSVRKPPKKKKKGKAGVGGAFIQEATVEAAADDDGHAALAAEAADAAVPAAASPPSYPGAAAAEERMLSTVREYDSHAVDIEGADLKDPPHTDSAHNNVVCEKILPPVNIERAELKDAQHTDSAGNIVACEKLSPSVLVGAAAALAIGAVPTRVDEGSCIALYAGVAEGSDHEVSGPGGPDP